MKKSLLVGMWGIVALLAFATWAETRPFIINELQAPSPVLSGTVTGTYTLGGTPSITAPTITGDPTFDAGAIVDADITSITTRSKLPANLVYDDEANTFTVAPTFPLGQPLNAPTLQSYTIAGLPAAGTAGRLARVTDGIRGIWKDTGTAWVSVTGEADVADFGAFASATAAANTTAIQAAINALPSTGGIVRGGEGTYLISSPLLLKSHTKVIGLGMGRTTIKLADNVMPGAGQDGARIFTNTNWGVTGSTDQNIEISDLTLDGNAANNPDIAAGSAGGISFGYATNIRIRRVQIKDVDGYGAIYLGEVISGIEDQNPAITVEGCFITGSISSTAGGSYGTMMFITAPQTKAVYVHHNYGYNNRHGIALEDSPSYAEVIGNVVERSSTANPGQGIWVNAGSGTAPFGKVIIKGNFVKKYNRGIVIDGQNNGDTIITGNFIEASQLEGIMVATPGSSTDVQKNLVISNNIVKNTQAGPGIGIYNAATDIIVANNRLYDDQSVKTQTYGISTAHTANYLKIHDNDVRGNLTGAMSLASTGANSEIHDNMGYNPVGISTITPASDATITAGASPETIYIYGGTVTSISKDSIQVGTSSPAQVYLAPNSIMTITYSAAPTVRRYIH